MAPLSIPATDEEMPRSWATGNRSSGIDIQMIPTSTTLGQSSRATARRVPGTSASDSAPRAIRRKAISPGRKASSPMAIHRNEEPHMSPIAARRPHSAGPKASVRVPGAVVMSRGVVRMEPGYRLSVRWS
jgi:hypothetical protein